MKPLKGKKIHNDGSLGFNTVVYGFVFLSVLAILFPLLYIIMTSFASEREFYTRGFFIFPKKWTLEAYLYLITNDFFTGSFMNAIKVTVVGTSINMIATVLMAYGLSKKWLMGRKYINLIVVFTMIFSGGLIPTYMVINALGLINSYWAIWFNSAVSAFYLIVMRSFFSNIPSELEEAARMDGCGEWRMLGSIYLPLSKPAIATFSLFYMVHNWNTYFAALLFLNDSRKWPLQVFLRQMLVLNDPEVGASLGQLYTYTPASRMAAILIAALPLLMVYPFLQKHFNKGMLLGSVKG